MCIQLRLLCNLLDGMVAIEGGRQTKSGEIFNDMPDRFADMFILVAAGYSLKYSWGRELGWIAAVLSVLTAYIRALGGATGATQYFIGPMAKQQRMAVLTGACLFSTLETWLGLQGQIMAIALMVISLGCVITVIRRTCRIVHELEAK
jgi:phosphatidylglycerophosphate synthase